MGHFNMHGSRDEEESDLFTSSLSHSLLHTHLIAVLFFRSSFAD